MFDWEFRVLVGLIIEGFVFWSGFGETACVNIEGSSACLWRIPTWITNNWGFESTGFGDFVSWRSSFIGRNLRF